MNKIKVYLDNCCYNRPYDDQTQLKVRIETMAKLYIQYCIKSNIFDLVSSYILLFENSKNANEEKKKSIEHFVKTYSHYFVDDEYENDIKMLSKDIMLKGIHALDACHISCAILANCHYLITTDKKILKFNDPRIICVSPECFLSEMEL